MNVPFSLTRGQSSKILKQKSRIFFAEKITSSNINNILDYVNNNNIVNQNTEFRQKLFYLFDSLKTRNILCIHNFEKNSKDATKEMTGLKELILNNNINIKGCIYYNGEIGSEIDTTNTVYLDYDIFDQHVNNVYEERKKLIENDVLPLADATGLKYKWEPLFRLKLFI